MASLMDKMLDSGFIKESSILAKSSFFKKSLGIPTDLPILNVAFSGSLDGGLLPGLTVFAGKSKSFKTMLALFCMKAYLDAYKDGIAILYDSEFGITPEYIEGFEIDINRVLHIPVTDIEQLKFDIVKKLESIDKKDKVFIMIDSIGNLASKKEVEDATNEKSVADMSRAKSLKSLFRIITPHLTTKNIPCIAINHVYDEMGMYPKAIVSGGSGIVYSSNQIFIISKSQEKDGDELSGFKFTINIEKSRYVKEKAKFPFHVYFDEGIFKWSSIFELAEEIGVIIKPSKGWYQLTDIDTGEIYPNKYRKAELEKNDEFFEGLVKNKKFKEFVELRYKLTGTSNKSSQHEDNPVDINEIED